MLTLRLALLATVVTGTACATSADYRYSVTREDDIATVFARVHSSVVTLRTISTGPTVESRGTVVTQEGVGSGTVISRDGKVLTAAHVVQTADEVMVEFFDGTSIPGRVVSSDPVTDLALVQLSKPVPSKMEVSPLGDSSKTAVGSQVFVVGAPLGISHTLTVGHLSARRLAGSLLGGGGDVEVFQTDAAINPGNSGGPLFNLQGEVIGIVSYIVTESGGFQGLGFAVTSQTAKERLLDRGPMWSGMDYLFVSGRLAEVLNLPRDRTGFLVQRVASNSPAGRLGLRGGDVAATIGGVPILLGGDIVLEVLGVKIEGIKSDTVRKLAETLQPQDQFTVKVLREGRLVTLNLPYGKLY